jgi:hypothetical protein
MHNTCINNDYWCSSNNTNLQVVGNILFYYYTVLYYFTNSTIYVFIQNANKFIENNILYVCSFCLSYLINIGLREIVRSPNTFNTYKNILQSKLNNKFPQQIKEELVRQKDTCVGHMLEKKELVTQEDTCVGHMLEKEELKMVNKLSNIDTIKFNISFVNYIDNILRDSSVENALRKVNEIKIILDNKYDKLILNNKSRRNNKNLLESIKEDNKDN